LSFTANRDANGVLLQWVTANETNNSHFEVERSSDGIQYIAIGTVFTGNQPYRFEDIAPAAGTNYYRIKQIDEDNNSRYSGVATVDIDNVVTTIVYPNPAKNIVNIQFKANAAHVAVLIMDAAGRITYTTTVSAITAGGVVQVPVSGFAAGVYVIKVKWDTGAFAQQLMVN
jgi:hypothetical protein